MASANPAAGILRPTIGLWGLLAYGIVVIQPTAPLGSFGVVSVVARGHVATALLLAMVAMVLTAVSYGRMANAYPSAGSAYTFVGRSIHPQAGFLVGWCIILDYLLLPTIGTIWCAKAAMNIVALPYPVYIVAFGGLFTAVNLLGLKAATRTNFVVATGLLIVIAIFLVTAALYVARVDGASALISARPFYDPQTFAWDHVSTGASIAVLTYMGFDCISTLSEDVRDPRRNVLRATVLLCVITGVFGCLQVYFGQLVWPDFRTYPDPDTAFVSVAGRAGGPWLFHLMNAALLVATIGSSLAAQLGAGRLLFAMGRDDVIPRPFFGHLHEVRQTPTFNLLLVGSVIIVGGLTLSYQSGAELVNFGAFIAFMGVNLAAIAHYYLRADDRGPASMLKNLLPPALGTLVCAYIWWSLRAEAKIVGFAWLGLGLAYCAWRTRLFQRTLPVPDALGA